MYCRERAIRDMNGARQRLSDGEREDYIQEQVIHSQPHTERNYEKSPDFSDKKDWWFSKEFERHRFEYFGK
jgi:hypothetical protein